MAREDGSSAGQPGSRRSQGRTVRDRRSHPLLSAVRRRPRTRGVAHLGEPTPKSSTTDGHRTKVQFSEWRVCRRIGRKNGHQITVAGGHSPQKGESRWEYCVDASGRECRRPKGPPVNNESPRDGQARPPEPSPDPVSPLSSSSSRHPLTGAGSDLPTRSVTLPSGATAYWLAPRLVDDADRRRRRRGQAPHYPLGIGRPVREPRAGRMQSSAFGC